MPAETVQCYFRGKFMPFAEAKVGVMTHALNYGTGVFEGIRAYWNAEQEQLYLLKVREHYDRLRHSCRIMRIKLPHGVDELCDITRQLVEMNGYREDVYVRPLAFQDEETITPRLHDVSDALAIYTVPMGAYIDVEAGVRVAVSSWRRMDDNMIPPRAKVTGLYVNSALAKTEALENGFDEAIMLTQAGYVSEGSAENIFLLIDGKLVTPSPSQHILMGITRAAVIELAGKELGIETVERQIGRSELYVADEVMLVGTGAQISPVVEIDRRAVGSGGVGAVTAQLQRIYFDAVRGNNPKYASWSVPVYKEGAPTE
ncbi:MAG: branched chain amino acid aminotransferase [Dehalococcoidia bacterium]|nr:branched chain amino acid aminotransferase [Dehalococcoidia bacterium]